MAIRPSSLPLLAPKRTRQVATGVVVARVAGPPKTLVLPYPPSNNSFKRQFISKGKICTALTEDAKNYKAVASDLAIRARLPLLTGDVRVTIDVFRPRKVADLDNLAKLPLDSLSGIAYADDGQIVELHMRRFDDKFNPRLEITVEEL